jgi:hypothetical protein
MLQVPQPRSLPIWQLHELWSLIRQGPLPTNSAYREDLDARPARSLGVSAVTRSNFNYST